MCLEIRPIPENLRSLQKKTPNTCENRSRVNLSSHLRTLLRPLLRLKEFDLCSQSARLPHQ